MAHGIFEFIQGLNVTIPDREEFIRLGDMMALRYEKGHYFRANYERGMLLYALLAKYRPETVIEFGTGRGYGTFSMAWAMADQGIDGHIYTIDIQSPEKLIQWPLMREGKPIIETASRNDVWGSLIPEEWRNHVHLLSGDSSKAIRQFPKRKIEFAFIDGGHDYDTVRHDFYSILKKLAPQFGILFDDYETTGEFGIRKFIDEEIFRYCKAEILNTVSRDIVVYENTRSRPYKMVWLNNESATQPITDVFDTSRVRQYLLYYYLRKMQRQLTRRTKHLIHRLSGKQ